MLIDASCAVLAVLLDRAVGEPRRWHPLVGFGRLAAALEHWSNRGSAMRRRLVGGAAVIVLVGAPASVAAWLVHAAPGVAGRALDVAMLWFALGARSLREHLQPIGQALVRGDLPAARVLTARIVSRDTAEATPADLAKAAVESALENGNDAVFGALWGFAWLGGPGALAFRLANTLDAMWGYRSERFLAFGWAAARLDDVLNWLPARATALGYALLGHTRRALRCWQRQAPHWPSPNAGPVMAAGAGALGLALGREAVYGGRIEQRPPLGQGRTAAPADIARAWRLVSGTLVLWLVSWTVIAALCDAVRCIGAGR